MLLRTSGGVSVVPVLLAFILALTAPVIAQDVGPNCVTLHWTATGDDGYEGTAEQYDIRYATFPISESNWDQATRATNSVHPHKSGSHEALTIGGLESRTTYYFALKVGDEADNWSPLSNVVARTTTFAECEGSTGDANCDGVNGDIMDLTVLVLYLFSDELNVCVCHDEANVNGTYDGTLDVADLTLFVKHLFVDGRPLANCW